MTEQTSYAYGYARMPRIIRKGYKNLTKLQKLLYIYLRDLAGEDGTCYRSLRTLQEETGFSIGYLSENIPILHNEGLIHAEMKSSSQTHWQVWHISIVDIWEKNAAFLQSEKCSPDEQLTEQSVHQMNSSVHGMNTTPESVHTVNESVHTVTLNKNHTKNQLIEKRDREEREEVADATARSSSSQEISQDDEDTVKKEVVRGHHQHRTGDNHLTAHSDLPDPVQPEHRKEDTNKITQPPAPRKPRSNPTIPRRPRPQQQELTDEIPATAHSKPVEPVADMAWGTRKCLQWFDYWRGGTLIARYKLQQAASCAKGLAEQFDEATFIEIRNEMAADQYYIDRGGVDVCDVANNCHKYLNKIRTKQKPPSNEHKAVQHANAFIARGYDKEYNKRKLEEMRAENERRRQAAGGVQ